MTNLGYLATTIMQCPDMDMAILGTVSGHRISTISTMGVPPFWPYFFRFGTGKTSQNLSGLGNTLRRYYSGSSSGAP